MVVELSVLPKGRLDELFALFKYMDKAIMAETYISEVCESTEPLRDQVTLWNAQEAGLPVVSERCPRCVKYVVDRGAHAWEPRNVRLFGGCNYDFTVRESVVAHSLCKFNPVPLPDDGVHCAVRHCGDVPLS